MALIRHLHIRHTNNCTEKEEKKEEKEEKKEEEKLNHGN
jgi:hypothetical protein